MKMLLARLERSARSTPRAPAVTDGRTTLSYAELLVELSAAADAVDGERLGLFADNGCPWAVLDLAAARREMVCVPVPAFFSDAQVAHVVSDAGLDTIVTDRPERLGRILGTEPVGTVVAVGWPLSVFRIQPDTRPAVPAGTGKVTYTSGTTGTPKGVCLSPVAIERVTFALCEAAGASTADRSLSLLPLSTLLENIGGLYAPLWAGGVAQVPPLSECGVAGSSGLDPRALTAALRRHAPSTVILVPQLLKVLTECAAAGLAVPRSLRLAAVGGAAVSDALIRRARAHGIPAFEGYGLSEAGSVAALNLPGADRPGSAGRPLPHVRLEVDDTGEIVVHGHLFLGYLGAGETVGTRWPTGDLGRIDEDGYLHVTGRRKTAFATAFGRNVAPEWVESELTAGPAVAQAAVFGEGRPFNVAVVVPGAGADVKNLRYALDETNRRLPDYARVRSWVTAEAPFTADNGLAAASGAVLREAVEARYREQIEALYQEGGRHAVL